ncbi:MULTISPECIES: DUF5818 domain-containing protein [Sphingobium]|uniref:DUF5818 domain-containing protein n=1 Tax=Sphingobium TaxID=165695 RepID=UPI000A45FA51|nr:MULTISPECIES: DUF5818 domain-containing protein [Sphingobium]
MPRGTRHIVTGILNWDERNRLHVLTVEGGGYWFLDMPLFRRTGHLIGHEVTAEGIRSDFNLLDVDRIWRADKPRPSRILERLRAFYTPHMERLRS